MIDMTLSELLAGLYLSDDEITAELDAGKNHGAKPESDSAAVVSTEIGKEKPVE
jgi:hypothetical protein